MSELEKRKEGRGPIVAADLGALVERTRHLSGQADAENTRRTYATAWRDFESWCIAQDIVFPSLPAAPETVSLYLADCASRLAASTIRVRLSAIDRVHREAGLDQPGSAQVVRRVLRGIRREKGVTPKRSTPLIKSDLLQALRALPKGARGIRDRAVLLLGFHGAFRRSELTNLNAKDVREEEGGLVVVLRRSKTDQDGQGLEKGILFQADPEFCPVRAWRAWIEIAAVNDGCLFRSVDRHGGMGSSLTDRSIDLIVRRACKGAGLSKGYSAHSLRAGLATQAAAGGAPERLIMLQGGWTSIPTVRAYIRHASLFSENVGVYLHSDPAA